jgi:hypothetical protein
MRFTCKYSESPIAKKKNSVLASSPYVSGHRNTKHIPICFPPHSRINDRTSRDHRIPNATFTQLYTCPHQMDLADFRRRENFKLSLPLHTLYMHYFRFPLSSTLHNPQAVSPDLSLRNSFGRCTGSWTFAQCSRERNSLPPSFVFYFCNIRNVIGTANGWW